MENLIFEFENITKMKFFGFEVIDNRNNQQDVILFNISLDNESLIAEHIGLTKQEEESDKIAFKSIDLDICLCLDENLQNLSDECSESIIKSDFYQLVN